MALKIQLRRGTAAEWTTANPTLMEGEMGVETDTLKVKLGNGEDAWADLPYFTQGVKGDTGATGATGPQGPKGNKGDLGDTGPANTLTVGTVLTGSPGSSATVTIAGDAPNQTISFTIPKGDTGAQGIKGDKGDTGAGIPSGGDEGQVIVKGVSGTAWADNNLADLKDVTLTSPTSGQGLTYNGTEWVNATPVSALSGLSDVTIASVADKQVLQYESSSGKWKNKNATGGLTVSDTTPASPVDGDGLFYSADGTMFVRYNDGTSTQWVQPNAVLSSQIEQRYYSPNYLINGAFDIWQRGTSFTASTSYTADRWLVDSGTVTRQTGPSGMAYCLQVAGASGNPAVRQGVELPFAGNPGPFVTGSTWTVSFYAKVSTTITSNMALYVAFADGTFGGNAVQVVSTNTLPVPTTSWTRYSYSFTIAATPVSTNLAFSIVPYLNSGSYSGNFSIAGVQLEEGSSATAFRRNANSVQAELAACQRYYCINKSTETIIRSGGYGQGYSNAVPYPVTMRSNPTVTFYSGQDFGGTSGKVNGYQSGSGVNRTPTIWWQSADNLLFYIDSTTNEFTQFSFKADAEL